MSQPDALKSLLSQTGVALAPLRSIDSAERAVSFFKQLGYDFSASAFGGTLSNLAGAAGNLAASLQSLTTANTDEDTAGALIELLLSIAETAHKISELHSQLETNAPAVPGIDKLPQRLIDFLLLDYLDNHNQSSHAVLKLLGLIDHNPLATGENVVRKINWERVGDFFNNPGKIADEVYNWSADFDSDELMARLESVIRGLTLPGGLYQQSDVTRTAVGNTTPGLNEIRMPLFQQGLNPESYAQFGINFTPVEAKGGKKKGIALLPYLLGTAEFTFDVCERGELVFESSAEVTGIGVAVRPPFNAEGIKNLTGNFETIIKIQEKQSVAEELILIGSGGGSRLSIQGLGISWFMRNPNDQIDLGMEGHIQALRLVINGGEGDGFLSKILSELNVEAEASLGFGISLLNGFIFRGGASLAIELPAHIDLGPIGIEGLRIEIGPQNDSIQLDAGTVIKVALGPLKGVVENIGIRTSLYFREGNLGPADLDFTFKPPDGVGLSLDAGVVKGGGYLFFDFDREEYAGALEFVFSEWIALKAIGLITTKMPDGSKGFSLLIIITVEFGSGIQLGFGFTLLGVGGLFGLNRTIKIDPVAQGVRDGSIDSIMFPQDVVANAPKIISDLRKFFPPENGQFLIGPMAKIGYGTPTLMSLSLGVIIEFPKVSITILGVLKVILPDENAAVIKLQVNFVGRIEPANKLLWFEARLFDSRILFITIEGGLGLLVNWGDNSNFVFSVGGFHPRYSPPPMPFPEPPRLAVSILNESYARIRIEGYFALTSNTVQFGARAELFFGFSALSVEGHLGFDVLFQFNPFFFIFEFSAGLSIKVFGFGLFSISISGLLEGPAKWHIKGKAKWKITWFGPTITVNIDETWGEERQIELPPIEILPLIEKEFAAITNWEAVVPKNSSVLVTLRKLGESEPGPADQSEIDTRPLVLHPLGILRISQRKMPLKLKMEKFGNQKPSDVNKLAVTANITGGDTLAVNDVQEKFASGEF